MENSLGVVANAWDSDILVCEFEIHSRSYILFRIIALLERYETS